MRPELQPNKPLPPRALNGCPAVLDLTLEFGSPSIDPTVNLRKHRYRTGETYNTKLKTLL